MECGKVLFLGPEDSLLIPWLKDQGERVIQTTDKICVEDIVEKEFFFLLVMVIVI